MKQERDLELEKKKMWPIYFDGKYWSKWECGSIFKSLYHDRFLLRDDGAIYVGDGSWVFPNDTFEHDENR